MVKLKWNGPDATRIRPEKNGEKVDMKPKEVLEVSDEQAAIYLNSGSFFEVVTADVKPNKVQKNDVSSDLSIK